MNNQAPGISMTKAPMQISSKRPIIGRMKSASNGKIKYAIAKITASISKTTSIALRYMGMRSSLKSRIVNRMKLGRLSKIRRKRKIPRPLLPKKKGFIIVSILSKLLIIVQIFFLYKSNRT